MSKSEKKLENLPASFEFIRSFQGIDEFKLKNGLQVLLFEDPSQANVTVNITYLVGSRHEGRGEAGMAHLLEHMLFRGTKKTRDVKGALQDRGAQFNATTWYDRTNYFETLTPSLENLEFALALEADRMINSTILQEDLDSEMTVVRNEFEMGENNPVHVLHDQVLSSAYRWHNYGKSTIGNRSDIERVPTKSLRAFYKNYYQPDNAVLIVAGQFDKSVCLNLIEKYFAGLEKPTRELDQTYTEEPAQDGPREVMLQRVGDVASICAAYHIPSASHEDHAAIRVFMDAIVDEPAGLLYKKFIESKECSEIFAFVYALYEPGMAMCFLRPSQNENLLPIRDRLCQFIENSADEMINEEQVERIKARVLKSIKQAINNSKNLALKLSEAIACGDWRLFFWYKKQIEIVDCKKVLAAAKKYFIESNRTSGVFTPKENPTRVAVEQSPNLAELFADLKEDDDLNAGEAFEASAKNIEALTHRKNSNEKFRMAFLPKKTRGQVAHASLIFRFSNEDELKNYQEEFSFLSSMLWRGCEGYNLQEIKDKLDSLMSSLQISTQPGILSAVIKSENKFIGETVALLGKILHKPSFDEKEFELVQKREVDDLEEIKNDPQRVAFQELERLKQPWPNDSIHYVPSVSEKIERVKKLDCARIKEAYNKLFCTNKMDMSVVGDADCQNLETKVQSIFGADSAKKTAYQRIEKPFIEHIAKEVAIDTPDKEMCLLAYGFNFAIRDDHEDYPALKFANYMFGENMNSRLMSRIREREGISYGAGSFLETSRRENNSSFTMYAMAAPQAITRAKNAMTEEWQKFLKDGFTSEEIDAAKKSIWLSFQNNLANDSYLASVLAHDLDIDRNFFWREKFFKSIDALSKEEILETAKKWWDKIAFACVCAGDQSKIK